jgi:hypothetical protein
MVGWVSNSIVLDPTNTTPGLGGANFAMDIVCVAVAFAVVGHSFYVHRWRYHYERYMTEIAAIGMFTSVGSNLLVSFNLLVDESTTLGVVFRQIVSGVIFYSMVQLSDNYMFYGLYLAVNKTKEVPQWHKVCLHVYIWIVLMMPWLPTYTIVPFFVDCNTDDFASINYDLEVFQTSGYILYNVAMTMVFLNIVYGYNVTRYSPRGHNRETQPQLELEGQFEPAVRLRSSQSPHYIGYFATSMMLPTSDGPPLPLVAQRLALVRRTVAIKTVIHCCVVTIGCSTWLIGNWGDAVYELSVVLSLHLLFNLKLEKLAVWSRLKQLWPKAPHSDGVSSITEARLGAEDIRIVPIDCHRPPDEPDLVPALDQELVDGLGSNESLGNKHFGINLGERLPLRYCHDDSSSMDSNRPPSLV